MKIALVSQEYPPETARGGIGSQTYAKAHGLAALGHQVFVISRSNVERTEISEGNITVIRIPGMDKSIDEMTEIVQWITHSIVVTAELGTLHKRVSLDLVDFPEWAAEGYTYLLNRTEWNTIPAVIQLHGPLVMFAHTMAWPALESEFYKAGTHMESTCVQLADGVYSSSQCSAAWIREDYNYRGAPIPVIHLGIDTKIFKPQSVQKNGYPTIIFIGKIVRNKGVEELVEAASQLVKQFPGLRVRMLGRGDENYLSKLQEDAANAGAPGLLEFAGFVEREDLPSELSKADVFCAPSYYEGGPGFVYLEAMACGVPVIGCSGSGVEEIVTHGETGMLVPPRDSETLKAALEEMLGDRKLLISMSVNARKYVLKHADSRVCLKRLEAYYENVIQNKTVEVKAYE